MSNYNRIETVNQLRKNMRNCLDLYKVSKNQYLFETCRQLADLIKKLESI